MTCTRCGCEQDSGAQYCRECGTRVSSPQPNQWQGYFPGTPQQQMRVSDNLQPLGIIWYVFGAYRLARGVIAAFALHTMATGGWLSIGDAPPFLPQLFSGLVPVVLGASALLGVLAILTGYGLSARRPWGRTLAIVMGIFALLKFPVGTGVGIYTLWVLTPAASGQAWQRIQQP